MLADAEGKLDALGRKEWLQVVRQLCEGDIAGGEQQQRQRGRGVGQQTEEHKVQ